MNVFKCVKTRSKQKECLPFNQGYQTIVNSFYLVIENSCFCSLFLFSVNAVRAVITSRTISDSRYYKDEKRGF